MPSPAPILPISHPKSSSKSPTRPNLLRNHELIECPNCERKFNKRAAERHIPVCKDIIAKPRPPPTKEEL